MQQTPREQSAPFRVRAFYAIAWPMIVSRAGLAAMSIADGVMVARWDAGQFAALALADGTLGRLLDVFVAFLFGALSLVPRYFARGDGERTRAVWLRVLGPAVVMGGCGVAAGWGGTWVLEALGQPPALVQPAGPVLRVLGAGFPAALLAMAAAVYLEGVGHARLVAIAVVVANGLNVLFNWLLIEGHAGWPALGAVGSAWSTTIVRLGLAVTLMGTAWGLKLPTKAAPDGEPWQRDQWRLGLSAAATVAVMVGLGAWLTIFAGWLGVLPLAAFSAALSLCGPAGLVAFGMADAAGIQVASAAGRGQAAAATAWASLRWAVGPVALLAAGLMGWAAGWAGVYTQDGALKEAVARVLPLAAGLPLVDAAGLVMAASLRALKEAVWPAAIEIVAMAVMVPLAAGLAWGSPWTAAMGVEGLLRAMLTVALLRAASLAGCFWWRTRGGAEGKPA